MTPVSAILLSLNKHHRTAVPSGGPKEDTYILCLGTTGCGISTFIERLPGQVNSDPIEVSNESQSDLSSRTKDVWWKEVDQQSGEVDNGSLFIGDVPGFGSNVEGLTDPAIVKMVLTSLQKQVQTSGKQQFRLGILLLQDISNDDRPRLTKDVEAVNGVAIDQILGNLTVVTTKWPSTVGGSSENSVASAETRHEEFRTLLSPLLGRSRAVLKENRHPGDEMKIVQDLVTRIGDHDYVIQVKDLLAPKDKQRSWLSRLFGWMKCFA